MPLLGESFWGDEPLPLDGCGEGSPSFCLSLEKLPPRKPSSKGDRKNKAKPSRVDRETGQPTRITLGEKLAATATDIACVLVVLHVVWHRGHHLWAQGVEVDFPLLCFIFLQYSLLQRGLDLFLKNEVRRFGMHSIGVGAVARSINGGVAAYDLSPASYKRIMGEHRVCSREGPASLPRWLWRGASLSP